MYRLSRSIVALTTLALGLGAAGAVHAQTAYVVVGGTSLASFDVNAPNAVTTIGNLSGAVSSLNDIDFRVANGLLYGYNQAGNQLVTINTTNAVTTFVANLSTPGGFSATGIDFNPVADRLRVVNRGDQNLRVNVANGATTVDGTLNYVSGDPRAGVDPNINDVAYTNNIAGATTTTLYYIDSQLGTLVTTSAPNNGTLNTVGSFGTSQLGVQGFDIFTGAGGVNTAYLLTNGGGGTALNTINLSTAQLSLVGNIGVTGSISGFAITPLATAAVPEPGSVALFVGLGVTGAGLLRKRRARK